jgi:hypothetical protein
LAGKRGAAFVRRSGGSSLAEPVWKWGSSQSPPATCTKDLLAANPDRTAHNPERIVAAGYPADAGAYRSLFAFAAAISSRASSGVSLRYSPIISVAIVTPLSAVRIASLAMTSLTAAPGFTPLFQST